MATRIFDMSLNRLGIPVNLEDGTPTIQQSFKVLLIKKILDNFEQMVQIGVIMNINPDEIVELIRVTMDMTELIQQELNNKK